MYIVASSSTRNESAVYAHIPTLAHSDTELEIQIIQGDEVWAKGDTRPADISISAFTTSVG